MTWPIQVPCASFGTSSDSDEEILHASASDLTYLEYARHCDATLVVSAICRLTFLSFCLRTTSVVLAPQSTAVACTSIPCHGVALRDQSAAVACIAARSLQTGRDPNPICGGRGHAGTPAMDPVPTAACRLKALALFAQDTVPCRAAVWPLVLEHAFEDDDGDTNDFAARRPWHCLEEKPESSKLGLSARPQGWVHISYRLQRSTATMARGTPPSAL